MDRERWNRHALVARPGFVDAQALWVLRHLLFPVVRVLHRSTLEGVERLPPEGEPYMLVANHPAGVGSGEFFSFMALYARAFPGTPPPLAGFVLAITFSVWPVSWIFKRIGAIPSSFDAGIDALGKRVPIFILPGGDVEAFRPSWQQKRVDFGGRQGFLRMARTARVPIVPMAFCGVSAPILFSSRFLAYLAIWPPLLGLKRFCVSALTVVGIALIFAFVPLALPWRALLAWAWFASPLTLGSWLPVRLRLRIGNPISHEDATLEGVESAITELRA